MKLLYYSPSSYGGIADYAHEQANALMDLGVDVTFLCTNKYPLSRGETYKTVPILQDINPSQPLTNQVLKKIYSSSILLSNFKTLVRFVEENDFRYVLLGSYIEYLAPLWSKYLRGLANRGVKFGAIVHDPTRNVVLGPSWWHRWSIACGYSFLREAFVHEAIELDTIKPMPQLRTTVIPFGVYCFPKPNSSREEIRDRLKLPLDAKVLLSFGHIRDNKNLDLVIQALANFSDVYLIVAGQENSLSQKPIHFYQDLAKEVGVAQRCRWQIGFIPQQEVANLFIASDLTVLCYSNNFNSASSVLSVAANYRKPCLASAGSGFLQSVVKNYQIGIWVKPDCIDSIIIGLKRWLEYPLIPNWEKYLMENSWSKNASLISEAFK